MPIRPPPAPLPDPIPVGVGTPIGVCCCTAGGGCCGCASVPVRYTVPSPEVANGTCPECALINLPHVISSEGGTPCDWNYFGGETPCSAISFYGIHMYCDNTYFWLDFIGDVGGAIMARYRKLRTSWNCLGANTLDLFQNTGACTNWPLTMTVTPV